MDAVHMAYDITAMDAVHMATYRRMKRIAKADAIAHKTWVRVMEDF